MAKALRDFARTNPSLVVKGGVLGDEVARPPTTSRPWPTSPPREVLLAQLAGASPPRCSSSPACSRPLPRNFAYGLKALIDQGGAPGAADARGRRRRARGRAEAAAAEAEAEPAAEAAPAPRPTPTPTEADDRTEPRQPTDTDDAGRRADADTEES